MTEQQTDYIAETAEALQLLEGPKPTIHRIEHPYELPGNQLFRMHQLNSAEDANLFDGPEAWLLESRVIVAWYLFVPVEGEAG